MKEPKDNEPSELPFAVIEFVHAMLSYGRYELNELSSNAVQFWYASDYRNEVLNGGHSQYIYNKYVDCDLDKARKNAEIAHAGLLAMGATAQAELLQKMMLWIAANPESVKQQTGFEGGRDEVLELWDSAFYHADEEFSFDKRTVDWIKSWTNLKVVDDQHFDAACTSLFEANPSRLVRVSAKRMKAFQEAATSPVLVSTSLALSAAENPEIFVDLSSRHEINFTGEPTAAYFVRSSRGYRYAIADRAGVAVYEALTTPRYFDQLALEHVGPVIGRVEAEYIDAFLANVAMRPVAAAADLLLRMSPFAAESAALSARGPTQRVPVTDRIFSPALANPSFNIVVGDVVFLMSQTKKGYILSSLDSDEKIGPVTLEQVEGHARSMQG